MAKSPNQVRKAIGKRLIGLVIRIVKFVREINNFAKAILILDLVMSALMLDNLCAQESGILTTSFVLTILKTALSQLFNTYKFRIEFKEIDSFRSTKNQLGS